MRNPIWDNLDPKTCPRCGGRIENRRRPLTTKVLLAIAAQGILGGVLVLPSRRSDLLGVAVASCCFGIFTLLGAVAVTSRYRKRLRCSRCWSPPPWRASPPMEVDFWHIYAFVAAIYVSLYVALYVIP